MAFSGALQLTELDDFITPAQECIKPVKIDKTKGKVSSIEVTTDGTYTQVNEDGSRNVLKKAQIDLNDCLACSGCVTTAEAVLVTAQSVDEFLSQCEALKFKDPSSEYVLIVSISPQTRASLAAYFGLSMLSTLRKLITFFKGLGAKYVFDTSWSRNFSLIESCDEFVERFRSKGPLPMLASSCPGWVCYAEKTHGEYILPYISTTKSPQAVMGTLVKRYLAPKLEKTPDKVYHITLMPCFDKKLEASRDDFAIKKDENGEENEEEEEEEEETVRETNLVLASNEVVELLRRTETDFLALEESPIDPMFNNVEFDENGEAKLLGVPGSSGGYLEIIFRHAAKVLFGRDIPDDEPLKFVEGRNSDFKETWLENEKGEKVLRFAIAYGFRNIQNIVRRMKQRRNNTEGYFHFVEVMACPSGCLNGGGQIAPKPGEKGRDLLKRVIDVYHNPEELHRHNPNEDDATRRIYDEWIQQIGTKELLHTQYHYRDKISVNPLTIKW